ncbi:Leucine Rich Repeat [Seminavis robusta]|uniref:Leucine Rich Repeat n=1 Tax=Seminavis robusta TaxID=568900 RepID=A0A9N8EFY6_9STRA|nr:Leucine Rich Repeat [Seminavis robusta]|eukprot:Sro1130_g244560.1 Leucine Rich Repeat (831) ;mRNA; r:31957-34449
MDDEKEQQAEASEMAGQAMADGSETHETKSATDASLVSCELQKAAAKLALSPGETMAILNDDMETWQQLCKESNATTTSCGLHRACTTLALKPSETLALVSGIYIGNGHKLDGDVLQKVAVQMALACGETLDLQGDDIETGLCSDDMQKAAAKLALTPGETIAIMNGDSYSGQQLAIDRDEIMQEPSAKLSQGETLALLLGVVESEQTPTSASKCTAKLDDIAQAASEAPKIGRSVPASSPSPDYAQPPQFQERIDTGVPGAYHSEPGRHEERRGGFVPGEYTRASVRRFSLSPEAPDAATTDDSTSTPEDYQQHIHGLVEAKPVSEELSHACPVDHSSSKKRENDAKGRAWFMQRFCILLVLGVTVVAIVIGTTSGRQNTSPDAEKVPSSQDVDDDPADSSTSPKGTMAPTSYFFGLLPGYSRDVILEDTEGTLPQSRAYEWVLRDPHLENFTDARLLQRYAMATFYYSTEGVNWLENGRGITRGNTSSIAVPEGTHVRSARCNGPGGDQYTWLDYSAPHECCWYSMAIDDGKQLCNEKDEVANLMFIQNNLVGTIPPELALLGSLKHIFLMRNSISGALPVEVFSALAEIQELRLGDNQISGTIPEEIILWNETIRFLQMENNVLTGSLPGELWQLTKLTSIFLAQNYLTGSLAGEVSNLQELKILELSNNQLDTTIPSELGVVRALKSLTLAENTLGAIPSELGRLTNLIHLVLTGARLSSTLPSELGLLSQLRRFSVDKNPDLVGQIPASMGQLVPANTSQIPECNQAPPPGYDRSPDGRYDLDWVFLSDTGLTGNIPDEWCTGLDILCFDCTNPSQLCGCGCPCD